MLYPAELRDQMFLNRDNDGLLFIARITNNDTETFVSMVYVHTINIEKTI